MRELETCLQQDEEASGLHYSFLPNVAPSVQDVIENRSQEDILDWINANDSTASLLADTTTEASSLKNISMNTPVGHDSFIKDTVRKIGIGEVAPIEIGFNKIGVFEDSGSKIAIVKTNLSERSIGKISPWHITVFKSTFIHTGLEEFSKAQVTFVEPTGIEVGEVEVGSLVNNTFINSIVPMSLNSPISEVSFSPSVLSNQFFSIHDSTPQIIDRD